MDNEIITRNPIALPITITDTDTDTTTDFHFGNDINIETSMEFSKSKNGFVNESFEVDLNGDVLETDLTSPNKGDIITESVKVKSNKIKAKKVNIFQLYKYANCFEILLILLGVLCAIIQGSALQGPYVLMSNTIDAYAEYLKCVKEIENGTDSNSSYGSSDYYYYYHTLDVPHKLNRQQQLLLLLQQRQSDQSQQYRQQQRHPQLLIQQQQYVYSNNNNNNNNKNNSNSNNNNSNNSNNNKNNNMNNNNNNNFNNINFNDDSDSSDSSDNHTNRTLEQCQSLVSDSAITVSIGISICATIIVVNYYLHVFLFTIVADRLTRRVRLLAFENILRQNIGYFDVHLGGELNTRLTQDVTKYEIGIGNKVSMMISWFSAFLAGLIICLIRQWALTLFMCILLPVAAVISGVTTRLMKIYTEKEMTSYAKAGGVAEEALMNVRVVAAFAGQDKECGRYGKLLEEARQISVKSAIASSVGQGIPWFLTFTIAGLTIFLTGSMINKGEINPGFMFVLLGCMMQGLRALGFGTALLENVFDSQGAAFGIYEIIQAKTEIDSSDPRGETLKDVKGLVRFENIHFKYPARIDVPVLKGLTLEIKPGQSAALVGPSGCGKSTTIQLLQRFYDPDNGVVKLDGVDVKNLNISWLRGQIGVVSQDPVLFATTIEENIRFGNPQASLDEIKKAAIEADAHTFIMKLPEKYETRLNEQGTQLSRGEKQRISLARALVRQPKILLLDECTSALDNESEAAVQAALDKAAKGRTTIIIAHRLSTVKDCDVLFVVDKGVVSEFGTHRELLEMKGLYHKLVSTQMVDRVGEDTENSLQVAGHDERRKSRTLTEASSLFDFTETDPDKEKLFILSASHSQALRRIFAMNKAQWPLLLFGVVGGLLLGTTWPIFSLLLSYVLGVIVQFGDVMQGVVTSAAGIIGLGIGACTVATVSLFMLRYFGESLTLIVRCKAYRAMLHQELAWFDQTSNQVGSLTSRLADEATRIKMATGNTILYLAAAVSSVVCSVLVALISSWQLGLAVLPLMPLTITAGVIQGYMNTTYEKKSHARTEASGRVASEAIDKIRTIASLTKEGYFLESYKSHFDSMKKEARRRANVIGLSQSFVWFCSCSIEIVSVGFGMWLVSQGMIKFEVVFRILTVALVMAAEVGRANANLPELTSSYTAAESLLKLINRKPEISVDDDDGVVPETCKGEVDLSEVSFNYPTRPEVRVLKNFTLSAKRGQSIAIVGPSGGGKSTVVQLIERFYDVAVGEVKVDGIDVQKLNLTWLRSQLGIVLQEPILFGVSIAENIAYGDNTRDVPQHEIEAAARAANIHDFIASLPLGYETNVGSRGTQLSGGQKQRMSIARALLRNPKILLLDDATSALDSHSESIVEEALQKARAGRTSIVIAHRLSSIVNADVILYVKKGRVVESGSHAHLMSIKGYYYKLCLANLGNKK